MAATYKEIVVTPALAKSWLQKTKKNRALSVSRVKVYEKIIESQKWRANGEAIKFNSDDELIDGQHRLAAVVNTGIPTRMSVLVGLPNDVFPTLDQGKVRCGGDVLGLSGVANANAVAAGVRWFLYLSDSTLTVNEPIPNARVLETVEQFPNLIEWGSRVIASPKVLPSAAVGVLAYAELFHDLAKLVAFCEAVRTGENMTTRNPAFRLRERLTFSRYANSKTPTYVQVVLIIKALNAYLQGRELGVLRYNPEESFPILVGTTALS